MDALEGDIVGNNRSLSLRQLCRSSGAHAELIIEMVEEGVLEPQGREPASWRFAPHSLTRIHSTLRLRGDLDVNLSGAALALELLDEIERLRHRVRMLECRFGE